MTESESSDREMEIQVRSLTGESVTLHIPPSRTVQHLKLLLTHSFPPATNSPNFHLFFKGDKLRPQARIGSHPIQNGEFLVLVPFAKKDSKTHKPEASSTPSNVAHSDSASNLADSTWSNIMEDLSHLREATESDALDGGNASNLEFGTIASDPRKEKVDEAKGGFGPDKQMELPYHLILNTLEYTSEGALGEHNCEVFSKVLESVNCLSDLPLGHCKLFKRARLIGGAGGSTCLCPVWLKMVMKAFAFMNIFSAFLHLQGRKMTSCLLEEALNRLGKFGVQLGLQDMKHLSLLRPQLVRFGNDIEKTGFGDVIFVINHSSSDEDQIEDNPKRGVLKMCTVVLWF